MESIYEKIRELRTQQNMTLKELSAKSGLSISFLSQVERGNSSLAITSLQKIAEVLNVPITAFFEEQQNSQYFVPESDRKQFQIEGSSAIYVRLGGDFTGRALEPFHVTLHPGQKQEVVFNHPGEEFYYVIEGQVIFTVDGQEYHLTKGDSIHFPSTLDHTWFNPTEEAAQVVSVLTPVIFKINN
ncbi:helix-turn-helix domain-containing protein [Brevibacillus reuszeri]|uniref:helix-turn-helix domain-containing protein n=1 Tax=Brevibacillus reuszeri TaxID=54915 RepID=UPI00259A4522|nr:XRE family transcriptional regulator [Brevibacillus reuszeri]